MRRIIGAACILICSAICASAFAFLSFGTGWSDNVEFAVIWLLASVGAVIACRLP